MAIEIPSSKESLSEEDQRNNNEELNEVTTDTTEVSHETDPMKIRVEIPDQSTPIVVLFGPPASGKTMMLIRMARWLKKNGYSVEPNRLFRPNDALYTKICNEFNEMVDSDDAAEGTNIVSFMLATVTRNQRAICQILEAPGEHFHNHAKPTNQFPPYLNRIISNARNRKIYLVLTEADWELQGDSRSRDNYVEKIAQLRRMSLPNDKFIVVLNKVDLANCVRSGGVYDVRLAKKEVRNLYPGIFDVFKNTHPISSFFKPSFASFVAFQSGTFTKSSDGNSTTFEESNDLYVSRLWKMILDYCK